MSTMSEEGNPQPGRRSADYVDTKSAIQEIKTDVHELTAKLDEKQDKIPLSVILGILVFMLTTVGTLFNNSYTNAANFNVLTNKIENINSAIKERSNDRFRGTDAVREFNLRDQRMDFFETRWMTHERDCLKLKTVVEKNSERINGIETRQAINEQFHKNGK